MSSDLRTELLKWRIKNDAYNPDEARDAKGEWTAGGGGASKPSLPTAVGRGVGGAGAWSGSQVTVESGKVKPGSGGKFNEHGDPDPEGQFVRNGTAQASKALLAEARELKVGGNPEATDRDKFLGLQTLKLSELSTNQALVAESATKKHLGEAPSTKPLIVAKLPSGYLLIDGNHRASTATLRGDATASAKVFDFTMGQKTKDFPESPEPKVTEHGMELLPQHYADKEITAAVDAYVNKAPKVPGVHLTPAEHAAAWDKVVPILEKAHQAQGEFQEKVRRVKGDDFDKLKDPDKVGSVKGYQRSAFKVMREYDGDASKLSDVLRTTLIMPTEESKAEVLRRITKEFGEPVRVKDRFANPTPDGYKDLLTTVKMGGLLAEIQATTPEFAMKKALIHPAYKVGRALPADHPYAVAGRKLMNQAFSTSLVKSPSFKGNPSMPATMGLKGRSDQSDFTRKADPSVSRSTGTPSTSSSSEPSGRDFKSSVSMPESLPVLRERIKQKLDAGNPSHKGSGEGGGQFTSAAEAGVGSGGGTATMERPKAQAPGSTKENLQTKESGGIFKSPVLGLELAPNPDDKHTSELWSLIPPEAQEKLTHEFLDKAVPEIGRLHGVDLSVAYHLGGYEDGGKNQSSSVVLPEGLPGEKMLEVAHSLGYALSQKAVMAVSPQEFAGGLKRKSVFVKLPDDKPETVDKVYQSFRQGRFSQDIKGNYLVNGHTTHGDVMELVNTSEDVTDAQFLDHTVRIITAQGLEGRADDRWSSMVDTTKEVDYGGSDKQGGVGEKARPASRYIQSSLGQIRTRASQAIREEARKWGGS